MKKQLVSILFALCMVLCLVPLAAFAEGETENVRAVTDPNGLFNAMADTNVTTVKLAADIYIGATLTACGCWMRKTAQRLSTAVSSPAGKT